MSREMMGALLEKSADDLRNEIDELTLMLDIFNSSIVTGVLPLKGSDCHKKILELMQLNGRKATAGSNNDK